MQDALAIHRWLLARQIHHEIVRLPRVLTSADELPEMLGVPPETCVTVTVFEVTTRGCREPVAVISSVARKPRPSVIAAALGADRVRPASSYTVNAVTDYAAGLVCPLLLPEKLTLLIDRRLVDATDPDVFVHTATGERMTALRLRAVHLFPLASGKPVELAGHGLAS
ncbi:YbaK/EbsC family protein [Herbidospora yilanensis]|uniref:YbaK/EbsC family protein n=1 Tax=Herbidospora yilanensis TaxID=354426 RepID=UPI00078603A2|nr:YbaK/EbsC family protein [Herbidospora yilanensis]